MEILQGVCQSLSLGWKSWQENSLPRCAPVPEVQLALSINTGASQADLPVFDNTIVAWLHKLHQFKVLCVWLDGLFF